MFRTLFAAAVTLAGFSVGTREVVRTGTGAEDEYRFSRELSSGQTLAVSNIEGNITVSRTSGRTATVVVTKKVVRGDGDLVKAMRACPQPVIAAIDGVCTGAGAMIACGSDMRVATARSKLAFLFVRVGLAGADMGACTLLPRLIGLSRAADLLYTGRVVGGEEAERFGFYNRLVDPEKVLAEAQALARELADGPTFGHAMTKTMLWQEWNSGLGECIEAEAQAQAICMQTKDFERAYHAFAAKQKPVFEGN